MNVFLDTSAVIKLYHKEVGSDELLAFLHSYAHDLILTVADITRTEFHSAFLRRVRMREIPIDPVYAVFDAFDHDLSMFNQIPVDDTVKKMAVTLLDRIAHQRGLRTLDAFQLAAALFCHQIVPVDTFVTSDHRFLKVAKDYFTVFNPEDKATP
jgi:predicted nucleic acid-binding protein